ncbi:MAG: hypothetical protein KM310_04585 [Clostridiales bacterium]|nr:hypothetical protein [Clostridiales bacterium]
MEPRRRKNRHRPWRNALSLGALGFAVAAGMALPSEAIVSQVPYWMSIPLVGFIGLVAMAFDMVGVAVTAADEAAFHAKASKKEPGARQTLYLLQHASSVSTIALDIVGDVTATVAGAATISIVSSLASLSSIPLIYWNALGIGLVGFYFTAGKAYAKYIAVEHANRVMEVVGKSLMWLPFGPGTKNSKGRKKEKARERRGSAPGPSRKRGG